MKQLRFIRKYFNLDCLAPCLLAVYFIASLAVSLNRYWQYQAGYFDLGIFDAAIWKVSRFKLPIVDHVNWDSARMIFADHFNPSIFLLSPFFWLTDRTEVLLILQSGAVSLAGLIGYRLAADRLEKKTSALALLIAFLGYVGLQNAIISDFHAVTVGTLVLIGIFWAVEKKKWVFYFLFLIVLLGLKESLAGLGIGLGLYLFLRDRTFRLPALITVLLSLVWGFLAIEIIIPYFSGGVYAFSPSPLPSGFSAMITAFTVPETKLKALFYTYLTFGFLPLFDLSILPMVFENFFERFVLSSYKGHDLGMHYSALLSPMMFIGGLRVLGFLEKNKVFKSLLGFVSIVLVTTVVVLHQFVLHGPLGLFYNPVFYQQNQRTEYLDNFLEKVPREGIIMTQNTLAPRFAHGEVRLLRENYQQYQPDLVVLNLTPGQAEVSYYPLNYQSAVKLKEALIRDENYHLEKFGAELYLFKKIN